MSQFETIEFFARRLADGALLRLIEDAEASFLEDADYVRAVATDILIERGFIRTLEQI